MVPSWRAAGRRGCHHCRSRRASSYRNRCHALVQPASRCLFHLLVSRRSISLRYPCHIRCQPLVQLARRCLFHLAVSRRSTSLRCQCRICCQLLVQPDTRHAICPTILHSSFRICCQLLVQPDTRHAICPTILHSPFRIRCQPLVQLASRCHPLQAAHHLSTTRHAISACRVAAAAAASLRSRPRAGTHDQLFCHRHAGAHQPELSARTRSPHLPPNPSPEPSTRVIPVAAHAAHVSTRTVPITRQRTKAQGAAASARATSRSNLLGCWGG